MDFTHFSTKHYFLAYIGVKKHKVSQKNSIHMLVINKTISDGGITVDFSIIKVHTSN